MQEVMQRVQRQVEQEYLQRLRRDIRQIDHLKYISVLPHTTQYPCFPVEGDIGECSICQETFQHGEHFMLLPCNDKHPHKFHKFCISPWLKNHDTCPMCRGKV